MDTRCRRLIPMESTDEATGLLDLEKRPRMAATGVCFIKKTGGKKRESKKKRSCNSDSSLCLWITTALSIHSCIPKRRGEMRRGCLAVWQSPSHKENYLPCCSHSATLFLSSPRKQYLISSESTHNLSSETKTYPSKGLDPPSSDW